MPEGDDNSGKQVSRQSNDSTGDTGQGRGPTNHGTDTTYTLEPLKDASPQDWLGSNQDPDVLLAVPNLGIDRIKVEVDNLNASVRLHAKVLDLLELHVGADVHIDKVDIEIDNVRVQAMLKVKLDKVVDVVSRVMDTIDAHPEILSNLTAGIGKGVEGALTQGGVSDNDNDEMEGSIEGNTQLDFDDTTTQDNQQESQQDERHAERDNRAADREQRRQRHQQRRRSAA